MVDPKRRYQDIRMMDYWRTRDRQVDHEEVYQGSSTYMMQQVGNLRQCSMRQRARRVKLAGLGSAWETDATHGIG